MESKVYPIPVEGVLIDKDRTRSHPCRHMVKEYQEVLCSLFSIKVDSLLQAYSLGASLSSYGVSSITISHMKR